MFGGAKKNIHNYLFRKVSKLYIRNGPNLNKVEISSDEITVVKRRYFINN